MSAQRLARELDGARAVVYHHETEQVAAWYGGCGVNVYCAYTGQEVDYWTMSEQPDAQDAAHQMRLHLTGGDED